MTLPDPPPADDDEPEMEPIEPVSHKDSRTSAEGGDEPELITHEELDQIETLMKGDQRLIDTHTTEVTRLFTKIKNCGSSDPAHSDLYRWYMRRLRGVACSLIYGNRDVVTEGGLNDEDGLLTEAYLKLLKLLKFRSFKFNDRTHFFHQAKLELGRVVKDAIRKKKRRVRLQRERFQDGRQGRVNANQEIEGGEEKGQRHWQWDQGVENPKGIHRAILKYTDRLPEIEPKHLAVYFRKILGDPIEQIADDLGVTTATAESWTTKARRQILELPREDT